MTYVVLLVSILIALAIFGIIDAVSTRRALSRAESAYRESLRRLTQEPASASIHNETLARGRAYAFLTQQRSNAAVFDEVALMNDILDACAPTVASSESAAQDRPEDVSQDLLSPV